MLIYKILRPGEWDDLKTKRRFAGSPADLADGFIHFSTAQQLDATLDKHFAGEEGLVLAAVETARLPTELLDALKFEPARDGQAFPHLYAALPLTALRWAGPLTRSAQGAVVLPEADDPMAGGGLDGDGGAGG